jgi:hypothetical protein
VRARPPGATRLVVFAHPTDDFAIVDVDPEGESPGDQILFSNDLFDRAGKRIGYNQVRCEIMFRDEYLCDAGYVLDRRGQIVIHGAGLRTFAVTGGTGEFARAHGEMYETFLPNGTVKTVFDLYLG